MPVFAAMAEVITAATMIQSHKHIVNISRYIVIVNKETFRRQEGRAAESCVAYLVGYEGLRAVGLRCGKFQQIGVKFVLHG